MIHRSQQGPPPRVQPLADKPEPELKVPVELGPERDTPTRIHHATRIVGAGCDARHPNRGQRTLHEKRPRAKGERDAHEEADKLRHLLRRSRCPRRRPLREEHAKLKSLWGRHRNRKRLSVHDPTQHLKTRIPIHDFSGGQEGRVRRTTFTKQAKMVRRKRLHRPHTVATARPPLHLD